MGRPKLLLRDIDDSDVLAAHQDLDGNRHLLHRIADGERIRRVVANMPGFRRSTGSEVRNRSLLRRPAVRRPVTKYILASGLRRCRGC